MATNNIDTWLQIPNQELLFPARYFTTNSKKTCDTKLHFSFFFDGMGFAKSGSIKKTGLISNIRALSVANEPDFVGCVKVKTIYISGMMTPLEVGPVIDTMLKEDLKDYAKEKAKDKAEDAAIDLGKEVKKNAIDAAESAKDKLKNNIPWERIKKQTIEEIKAGVKIVYEDLKTSIKDAFKTPGKLTRKTLKGFVPDLINGALCYIPFVRDSQTLSRLLNHGAEERIKKAIATFIEQIEANQMPITEIQISVFGADFGGGLARGFLNALVEECDAERTDAELKYELPDGTKVPLKMKFVGLFDSLGNRWSSADALISEKLIKYIPIVNAFLTTKNSVTEHMDLPACVEKVVHFISANECVTRVHTINNATLMPIDTNPLNAAQRTEFIYPGISWDISGSFSPSAYGVNNFLGDVTLQEMWRHARLAGVPLKSLKSLRQASPGIADRFDMSYTTHLRRLLRSHANDIRANRDHLISLPFAREGLLETGGKPEWQEALLLHRMTYLTWIQYVHFVVRRKEFSHRLDQYEYLGSQVYMLDWASENFVKRSKTHIGFEYITRLSNYEKCAFMHLSRYQEMTLSNSILELYLDYCHPAFTGSKDSTPNAEIIFGTHLYPLLPRFIDEGKDPEKDKNWWEEIWGYKKDFEEYLEIARATIKREKKLPIPYQ